METILLCEPTPEGIFTGVYAAYEQKLNPNTTHIRLGESENYQLFTEYRRVEASQEKAAKVECTVRKRFGSYTAESLWYAIASCHPDRGDAVYHTIARGLAGAYRGELMDYLQDSYVNLTAKLRQSVWSEAHKLTGFVRFAELESGLMYSEIEPKNDVLTFLGEHFGNRFPGENFIIRDKGRKLYLVHRAGQEYFLVWDKGEYSRLTYSSGEESVQELFRCFVHSISIKERENKKLQRQMLPLRFRPNMIDFK